MKILLSVALSMTFLSGCDKYGEQSKTAPIDGLWQNSCTDRKEQIISKIKEGNTYIVKKLYAVDSDCVGSYELQSPFDDSPVDGLLYSGTIKIVKLPGVPTSFVFTQDHSSIDDSSAQAVIYRQDENRLRYLTNVSDITVNTWDQLLEGDANVASFAAAPTTYSSAAMIEFTRIDSF